MMAFGNESNKERLEEIIRQEIVPKLKILRESLTEECIEYIILNSRLKRVTKDQYIQEPGTYEDGRLNFLYSGVAHRSIIIVRPIKNLLPVFGKKMQLYLM